MTSPTIAEEIYNAGQKIIASGSNLIHVLNQELNGFLSWPLNAASGSVRDSKTITDIFSTIIYLSTSGETHTNIKPIEVQTEKVACVIDVYESINLESLRVAYKKIVAAKKLEKPTSPQTNVLVRTETLGIILANNTDISLEVLADELQRLNQQTQSSHWPDLIALLSLGTISYFAQFPGEKIIFEFLLPAESIVSTSAPAVYVIPVITPSAQHTFNKICATLFSHLAAFSPSLNLPDRNNILKNTTNIGLTLPGYQFNLTGKLLPVPPERYSGRYIPPTEQQFKDANHDIFFTTRFLPWQDGGVIILMGNIPLQTILIYLGNKVKGRLSTIHHGDIQISSILPITENEYLQMLQKIHHQTSFKLQKKEVTLIKQAFLNEGTTSPLLARLFIGILTIRDAALKDPATLAKFDELYDIIINKLLSIKATAKEITDRFHEHSKKVSSGEIAAIQGDSLRITENINQPLRKDAESFVTDAARLSKHAVQNLVKFLNINIGCLYQNDEKFQEGIIALEASEPKVASYLCEARKWSAQLTKVRIDLEHNMQALPDIKYSVNSGCTIVEEPRILDRPVTEFIPFIFDRIACFIEDIIMHCLQEKMPSGISLIEIPTLERNPEMPVRFKLGLTTSDTSAWEISYSSSLFEKR